MSPRKGDGVVIKNKEDIFQEKTEKILDRIREYTEEMDALSDTSEFTIDTDFHGTQQLLKKHSN